MRGREQDFQKYCRPANAFELGRRGASHNAEECPEFLKPAFHFEYDRGSQLHQIESELAERRATLLNEFNHLVELKNSLGRDNAFLYHEADRLQLSLQAKLREFGR